MPKINTFDGRILNPMGGITSDAAIGAGLTFLQGELEKLDPKLHEPLTSVTWQRDMPVKTGGGFVESVSAFFVDYAMSSQNKGARVNGATTGIPIIQANVSKDIFKVNDWAVVMENKFIDMQKMHNVPRSLEQMYDTGIRLNWNKSLDENVYQGDGANYFGLVNNTAVTSAVVANGAGGSPLWANKTPDEILEDFNALISAVWAAAEYDLSGMPNHILIPPARFGYLVTQKVSSAGNVSILQYVLDNNIAKAQGINLVIAPSRWCIQAGTGSSELMVAYVNSEDKVNFDMTVPLMRAMTQPSVRDMAYLSAYVGQYSQVKFLYTQTIRYAYGI